MSNRIRKQALNKKTDVAKEISYAYEQTTVEGNVVNFYSTKPGFSREDGKNVFKIVTLKAHDLHTMLKSSVLEALNNADDGIVHIDAFNTHIVHMLNAIDRLRNSKSMKNLFNKEVVSRMRTVLTFESDKQDDETEEIETYDRIIPGIRVSLTVDYEKWTQIRDALQLMAEQ